MIKTSDEGTSYCTMCETYAKDRDTWAEMYEEILTRNGQLVDELSRALSLLATERDAFGKKETQLRAELSRIKAGPDSFQHAVKGYETVIKALETELARARAEIERLKGVSK